MGSHVAAIFTTRPCSSAHLVPVLTPLQLGIQQLCYVTSAHSLGDAGGGAGEMCHVSTGACEPC